MIKIAVCDDTQADASHLKEWIDEYAKSHDLVVYSDIYQSGELLMKHYGGQYDLIFLDIEMSGMNGVSTAKFIRRYDAGVQIVFATNYQDYAYESFQVDPSGYLLKSQSYIEFCKVFRRTLKHLDNRRSPILIQLNQNNLYVELGSIVYVEYFEHKLSIHFMDGTSRIIKGTLKGLLTQDKSGYLLHIHKNCLVNKIWIEQCDSRKVYLKGVEDPFEVSRPKWKEIENQYLIYCKGRLN